MIKRQAKKTVLLFGEGGKEKYFFNFFEKSRSFQRITARWNISIEHASGCSCQDVLETCIRVIAGKSFDLVLCFIDTDKLTVDFGKKASLKRKELDDRAKSKGIIIIWQEKNHEEELERATGGKIKGKRRLKERLKNYAKKIERSEFFKKIISLLK